MCNCNQPISAPPCEPPVYPGRPDCTGTACDDVYLAECSRYNGPNLPTLGINNGMFLKEALIALNKKLAAVSTHVYTIAVSNIQKTTVVEYINNLGALVSITVTSATSPQNITAQIGSPAIQSGTGTVTDTTP